MTSAIRNRFVFALLWLLSALPVAGAEEGCFPEPLKGTNGKARIVNDYVGLMSGAERRKLESKLVAYNDVSSTQIAIAIVETLCGYEKADYSQRLGEQWGVGQEGFDNGILIMASPEGTAGKRPIFIATGYGVEDVVPDVTAKRIIRNVIEPNFRQGKFYKGLDEGTTILIDLTTGKYTAADLEQEEEEFPVVLLVIIFIIILILFIVIANKASKQYNYSGDGTTALPGDFGKTPKSRRSGGWGGGWGGGTGGWGGGGGSSSSGGGFGGFGGGGFGGGGAGGGW